MTRRIGSCRIDLPGESRNLYYQRSVAAGRPAENVDPTTGRTAPQKREGPAPPGMSPSRAALPAGIAPDRCINARYAAFGFLPGAGAGTYPDTRHCHASIVLVPS